jgi:hypothetical protein
MLPFRLFNRPTANYFSLVVLTSLLWVTGCSQSPPPEVAAKYANQFGPTVSTGFGKCPELNGVWSLSAPSGGSFLDSEGKWLQDDLVPHMRWVGGTLFGLTPGVKGAIAASPRFGTTLFFSAVGYTEANPIPTTARSGMAYTELSEAEFPCVGGGWRQGPSRNHSSNDAAARVLTLDSERTVSITQVDYMAISASDELLLGTHVKYHGTDEDGKEVKDEYWHFVKLPRTAADAKAAGYSST